MSKLNKNAAALMNKYKCHGATDVTGFGIRGHALNLAQVQAADVDFTIESLPVISNMADINSEVMDFKLLEGYSAETSGGLLIMVPPERVNDFMAELQESHGQQSWIIGSLVEGKRDVQFGDGNSKVDVVPVMESFLADE